MSQKNWSVDIKDEKTRRNFPSIKTDGKVTAPNKWLNKAKPQLKELEQKIEIERMKVQ